MKTGKRPKRRIEFTVPVEVGDTATQQHHTHTLRQWSNTAKSPIFKPLTDAAQLTNDATVPPPTPSSSNPNSNDFKAFVKSVPGEFAVLCLVVIATILLLIAMCLPGPVIRLRQHQPLSNRSATKAYKGSAHSI